ncbi:LamG-like jellyroll fold domain-containing protein [Hymenobacter sp. B81]|uniref:LamG-like jellyroll fold domain-containing protein n=1 Tax=Hymenobacter sp. B81 TaxID=3344878 RepID=UPI0037DC76BB
MLLTFAAAPVHGQTLPGAGNSLTFNGFGNYVETGTSNRGITQQVTVEAWIRTSTSDYQFVLGKYSDAAGEDKGYHLVTNGGYAGFHGRAGVGQYFTSGLSATRVDDGRWHHLAGVCTGNTWQIYIDGVLENSTTFNYTNGDLTTSVPMAIGIYYLANGRFFSGQMDEVRVWKTARTAAQIRAAMCAKIPTAPADLVAYYRFDQSSGATATDAGSTPVNGALTNFFGSSPWTTSGAALGDASVSAYPSGSSSGTTLSLTAANGDAAQVNVASSNTRGVQLYAVNQAPNVAPAAGASSSYFGVFTTPASSTYSVSLLPQDGSPAGKRVYGRSSNEASWSAATTTSSATSLTVATQINRGEYILTSNLWTGAVSTVYTNPANWSANLVPTAADDVVIPANAVRMPVLAAAAAAASFTVMPGASMTVEAAGNLSLSGKLTADGSLTGLGAVSLTGLAPQVLSGAGTVDLGFLTVGVAGAQSSVPMLVRRVLTTNGNLALADNTLTLASDAQATAMLYNAPGTSVTGRVTVQRYLDGSRNSGAGYRHLAAPVQNTTLADLATAAFTPIVNPAYTSTTVPFPNVFYYSTARVGTGSTVADFDLGWLSPAATTDPMVPGKGFAVNISGNQVVDFGGSLRTTPLRVDGLHRDATPQSGWHLLGNPYPGPIDWNALTGGLNNLDNALYVFKSSGPYTGTYATYINGVAANGGSNLIPMGQGFFVRVSTPNAGSAALQFSHAARLTSYANPALQRSTETRPLVQLELAGSTGPADQATAYFQAGATPGFDSAYDAYKVAGNNPSRLAFLAGNVELSINGLPITGLATPVTLPLLVRVAQPGTYTLSANQLLNLPTGVSAFLHDAQTGTSVNLAQQSSYAFTATSAVPTGRFSVVLTANQPLAAAPARLGEQLSIYPNPAQREVWLELPTAVRPQGAQASLINALGQQVFAQKLSGSAPERLALPVLPSGVYTLRVNLPEGVATKRLVIE